VLPEDSQISRLTDDLSTVRSAAVSAADAQRRLQDALAECENNRREEKHSKSLDWGGEWKLAEDGFRTHYNSDVSAQRSFESPSLICTWSLSGGSPVTRSDIEAVCSRAGALLLSCPGFDGLIAEEVKNIHNDWQRWLEYLKEKHPLSDVQTGTCQDDDDKTVEWVQIGLLYRVAALSASECVKSAATALRFKQLW
jgi:hypothetical protein